MNSNTSNSENHSDWASRLEQMRQSRRQNTSYSSTPENGKPEVSVKQLDAKSRDKIFQAYVQQWQQEHNLALEDLPPEKIETDNMILLQDNWLNAQNALQMKAGDKQIESTRTVWFNPKTQTVEFPEAQSEPMPSENHAGETADDALSDSVSDGINHTEEQKIVVNINVLNPQAIQRRAVFCLSEAELTERLIKRMRPHITDAVNGMIRVALQKQMALLSYNLQQMLNEQAPDLVEDVLEHNLKRVLDDIKHEMKYKR